VYVRVYLHGMLMPKMKRLLIEDFMLRRIERI